MLILALHEGEELRIGEATIWIYRREREQTVFEVQIAAPKHINVLRGKAKHRKGYPDEQKRSSASSSDGRGAG